MQQVILLGFLTILFSLSSLGQLLVDKNNFTLKDSLRGGLRPERTCYDVLHYDLSVSVFPSEKFIIGNNIITFKAVEDFNRLQLDLFENLMIDSIIYEENTVNFERIYDAVFIDFCDKILIGDTAKINVFYKGHPIVAKNAPWDGGFVFSKDNNDNDWIGVAVQGDGASLWYPNKDHLSDEPNLGADIRISTPKHLMNVSNGRFIGKQTIGEDQIEWHWRVNSPINNYNITLNIGDYVHFSDTFQHLSLDYYVLRDNLERAKKHFEQVPSMLACFHEKLGYYPFPKDGYKLIETPYLGMEHQSAIAYGNNYKQGYLGTDLSSSGFGLHWDFIIVHESGHEWFGNSISAGDIADLWIHESFTTYTEAIYVECTKGKKAGQTYLNGLRQHIKNDRPMLGSYDVNHTGSGDIYYKGANMLGTIRNVINDDELWWKTLLDFTETFKHKITNTVEVIDFFETAFPELMLPTIFYHYLTELHPPRIEIKRSGLGYSARWVDVHPGFEMPIELIFKNKNFRVSLDTGWKKLPFKSLRNRPVEMNEELFYVERK